MASNKYWQTIKDILNKIGNNFKPEYTKIIFLFIISRAMLLFFAFMMHTRDFISPYYSGKNFLTKADASWFIRIINDGYYFSDQQQSSAAFSPLYPYIVKIISFFTGHTLIVGVILSNVCTILALILFYELIKIDFDGDVAKHSVLFFIVFPTSFFYSMFYAEGLFFMLIILSFYLWKKEKYTLACIIAGLATITKQLGIFIVLPFFVSVVIRKLKSKKIAKLRYVLLEIFYECLNLLIIPCVFGLQILFLYFKFGRWDIIFAAQRPWDSIIVGPLVMLKHLLNVDRFYIFTILTIIILFFVFYFMTISKIDPVYQIYSIAIVTFLISLQQSISLLRHFSIVFPFYIMLSLQWKNEYLRFITISILIVFQTMMFTLLINGYHIY